MKILTKELIEKKVFENDANWFFYQFDENGIYAEKYEEDEYFINVTKNFSIVVQQLSKIVEKVYDKNYGDGNEYYITYYFKDFDFYVSLTGTYNSYDEPEFSQVYFSEPYKHEETRYKRKGQ